MRSSVRLLEGRFEIQEAGLDKLFPCRLQNYLPLDAVMEAVLDALQRGFQRQDAGKLLFCVPEASGGRL